MENVVRTSMTLEHCPNVDFTKFKVQRVVNFLKAQEGSVD
jgi:hypothetical protein